VKEISSTDGTASPDLAAIKQRQQRTWASGDYRMIGTQILIVSELLIEALDLRSAERVLDVAPAAATPRLRSKGKAAAGNGAISARLGSVPSFVPCSHSERAGFRRIWSD
jgi:hypothetical protein